MKGRAAVTLENSRAMELTEYDVPDPGPEEVLIKITQATICGSDLHMWRGEVPWFQRAPGIQGHEMTGRVTKLGANRRTDSLGRPLRLAILSRMNFTGASVATNWLISVTMPSCVYSKML